MNWQVKDEHASTRIDDNVVSKFKKWFESYKGDATVTLTHCDPYFWLSLEERQKLRGTVGVVGPCVGKGCNSCEISGPSIAMSFPVLVNAPDNRPVIEAARVVVHINFSLPAVLFGSLLQHKLQLTANSLGDTLSVWNSYVKCQYTTYQCGYYKKSGFDKAFAAIKELKPSLTELEFCNYGEDRDLVTRDIFHGMNDCVKQESTGIEYETGRTCVTLTLLAPDVETNLDYITALLTSIDK